MPRDRRRVARLRHARRDVRRAPRGVGRVARDPGLLGQALSTSRQRAPALPGSLARGRPRRPRADRAERDRSPVRDRFGQAAASSRPTSSAFSSSRAARGSPPCGGRRACRRERLERLFASDSTTFSLRPKMPSAHPAPQVSRDLASDPRHRSRSTFGDTARVSSRLSSCPSPAIPKPMLGAQPRASRITSSAVVRDELAGEEACERSSASPSRAEKRLVGTQEAASTRRARLRTELAEESACQPRPRSTRSARAVTARLSDAFGKGADSRASASARRAVHADHERRRGPRPSRLTPFGTTQCAWTRRSSTCRSEWHVEVPGTRRAAQSKSTLDRVRRE